MRKRKGMHKSERERNRVCVYKRERESCFLIKRER